MRVLLLTLLVSLLSACSTAIKCEPIRQVALECLQRHDVYVSKDAEMHGAARDQALLEAATVDKILEAEEVDADALAAPLLPTLDRHDVYVAQDRSLVGVQQRVYLRSSRILREIVKEARR